MRPAIGFIVSAWALLTPLAGFPNTLGQAKIVTHLQPYTCQATCGNCAPTQLGCHGSQTATVTSGVVGTSYHLYLAVVGIDLSAGLRGAEFMVSYDGASGQGLDVFGWTSCAYFEAANPAWPDSGTGIRLTFLGCQNNPDPLDPGYALATLGALYVYAYGPDDLWVWPRTDTDYSFKLVDCNSVETTLPLWNGGGSAGFGNGHPGWNPCNGYIDEFPGTCCLPSGCSYYQKLECEYLGGTYLGFNYDPFEPVPCSECSTPVESIRWGNLKTRY